MSEIKNQILHNYRLIVVPNCIYSFRFFSQDTACKYIHIPFVAGTILQYREVYEQISNKPSRDNPC